MSFYLLRKYQKWILLPVGILMAISFGVGGLVSTFFGAPEADPYVGRVFGEEIPREDYIKYRNRMYVLTRGQRIRPEDVFERIALLKECDKQNITISKEEVREEIAGIKGFQDSDGVFDSSAYKNMFSRNNINPVVFEAAMAENIRIRKLLEKIRDSASVDDKEVMERYHEQNDKLSIQCVWVKTDSMEIKEFTPAEEDIKKYYTENKDSGAFDSPPKRKIEYIFIPYKAMRSKCPVSEGEVADYYEKNKDRLYVVKKDEKMSSEDKADDATKGEKADKKNSNEEKTAGADKEEEDEKGAESGKQYTPLEKVSASIKEKLMLGKTREKARQTANMVRRIIGTWPAEDVDFRDVIKKEELQGITIYGQTDFLSQKNNNTIRELGDCRGMISDAMSVTEPGARRMSMPITVEKGVVVTRVTGVMESKLQKLERVRDEVIRDLTMQKKEEMAKARADEIRKMAVEKETVLTAEFAKKEKAEFTEVKNKTVRAVSFDISGLFREALKKDPGAITEVIRVDKGYGFAKVLEKQTASEDLTDKDVKKKITTIRQNLERQKKFLHVWQWKKNLTRKNIEIYTDKNSSKKKTNQPDA